MNHLHKVLSALFMLCALSFTAGAQTKLGANPATVNANSLLELESANKGLLLPRVALTSLTSPAPLSAHVAGMTVYNTTSNATVNPGYYYNNGSKWVRVADAAGFWSLTGNAGTVDSTNFLGTTDNKPLNFRVNNVRAGRIDGANHNTYFGTAVAGLDSASSYGYQYTTGGSHNVAIGDSAFYMQLGSQNVYIGEGAGAIADTQSAMQRGPNVAIGFHSQYKAECSECISIGIHSLENTGGHSFSNIAIGTYNMQSSGIASSNVSIGNLAFGGHQQGDFNVVLGEEAAENDTASSGSVAIGFEAMSDMEAGMSNVALGMNAFTNMRNGKYNVGVGSSAGGGTLDTGTNYCTFVGASTSNNYFNKNITALGFAAPGSSLTGDNQMLIGNTAITTIRAQVSGFTTYSDARYKNHVDYGVPGLAFINRLKPATYNVDPAALYKIWGTTDTAWKNLDHSDIKSRRQIGFIAQEVQQAAQESGFQFPGIDVPQNDRQAYTLRYTDFIMPMVKSIQELDARNEALTQQNTALRAELDEMHQQIAALKAAITGKH